MKINENQSKRIYDKGTHTWIDVPEDQYREYDRNRTTLRKRKQYHHECTCPRDKFWLCDGICDDCEFHTSAAVSLDAEIPGSEETLGDFIPDDKPTPEEIASDRDLLERLIKRLRELDPDADRIIGIWKDNPDGISDRNVAEMLRRSPSTFRDQMKKFRGEFKDARN